MVKGHQEIKNRSNKFDSGVLQGITAFVIPHSRGAYIKFPFLKTPEKILDYRFQWKNLVVNHGNSN
jgi:hypothetical protein